MNQRFVWLDALKGIGILLVILSHMCHISFYLTCCYMPLFFIASGLTYKTDINGFAHLIKSKALRLLLPWFVYGLMIFIIERLYDFVSGTFTIQNFCVKAFGLIYMRGGFIWPYDAQAEGNMVGMFGPSWFLNCLFIAFIIYYGYDRCKYKTVYALSVLILAIVTYKIPFLPPWSIDISLLAFLFMLSGNKLKNIFFAHELKLINVVFFLIVFISFVLLSTYNGLTIVIFRNYGTHGYLSVLLLLITGVLYTLVFSRLCQWFEKTKVIKALAYIGRQSLRLLCIHMPIYVYTHALIIHLPVVGTLQDGIQAPFYIAEMLIINSMLDKLLKKYQLKYTYLRYL